MEEATAAEAVTVDRADFDLLLSVATLYLDAYGRRY